VRGLTTAASLWLTAAIGLAVGLRHWFAAVISTMLGVAVLWLVKYYEREWLPARRLLEVVLTLEPDAQLDRVEERAHEVLPRSRVQRISYSASGQQLVLTSQPEVGAHLASLGDKLRAIPGVQGVEVGH
jgi:putative Mg2+ transporter-C (MgtC) family protein